jgi:hypothetical protein
MPSVQVTAHVDDVLPGTHKHPNSSLGRIPLVVGLDRYVGGSLKITLTSV